MSFQDPMEASVALQPEEFQLVQRVYNQIVGQPWVPQDPEVRRHLTRYILAMYDRGLCSEKHLYALCLVAARKKFANPIPNEDDPQTASGQ